MRQLQWANRVSDVPSRLPCGHASGSTEHTAFLPVTGGSASRCASSCAACMQAGANIAATAHYAAAELGQGSPQKPGGWKPGSSRCLAPAAEAARVVGLHRPQGTPCWCQKVRQLQCRSSRGQPDGAAQGMLRRDHQISSRLTPATHKFWVFWFSSALSGPPSAFKTPAMPELPASLPIWMEEPGDSCCSMLCCWCLASAICLNLRAAGMMRTKD